jgi:hypothetical protein
MGKRYRLLSAEERAIITARCVLGWYRWDAKRKGLPPPVEMTFEPVAFPDGGIAAKEGTMHALTEAELDVLFPNAKPEAP